MSQKPSAVQFTQSFLDSIHLVDKYFQDQNLVRGKAFVRDLFSLIYDVVAVFPRSQPLFEPLCQQLPEREFRKVVFRKQYVAIYEVEQERVCFVLFRHSSLDPNGGFAELIAELI